MASGTGRMPLGDLIVAALLFAVAFNLAGCASDETHDASLQQGVAEVLAQGMEEADAVEGAAATTDDANAVDSTADAAPVSGTSAYQESEVDYDLSGMNADMVYATVYDMVSFPERYGGKIVRAAGIFQHSYFEATGQDYFFVLVEDAAACCAQGLEFVWDNGSHSYPDEYPGLNEHIVVTGVFEPYLEGTVQYVHLVNASMEVQS